MKPFTKENQFARELALSLNDLESLELYESYAHDYPESLLRTIFTDVMSVPEHKIKKSRAALFNFLVNKYAKRNNINRD